jgi:biopolymer transport protein ExbD
MNRILEVCLIALTFLNLAPVAAQSTAAAGSSSFTGTWKGSMNDLPGMDLTIHEADKKISGNVVFYFQERVDVNSPWRVTSEYAVPLLTSRAEGKVLTFEVEHHVCHGCPELGPNVTFRMDLGGPDDARLTRFEANGTEGAPMKMTRGSEGSIQTAPPMQAGISVEMPVTESATPMPEADQEDALIVTLTVKGRVYVGISPIELDGLSATLQEALSSGKPRKTLYIKADGRAPYATVMKIVDAAIVAGVEKTVLLTSQPDSPQPGTVSPPKGVTVVTDGYLCAPRSRLSL